MQRKRESKKGSHIINDCKTSVNPDTIFLWENVLLFSWYEFSLCWREFPFPAWPLYLTTYHLSSYFPYLGAICTVCVCALSHVQIFEAPWTVTHQAPPCMEFPRQEYWSGLSLPTPRDLPNPVMEPASLHLLHWQSDSLPLQHTHWETILTGLGRKHGHNPGFSGNNSPYLWKQSWCRDETHLERVEHGRGKSDEAAGISVCRWELPCLG